MDVNPSDLKDDVIAINRVTKVVKGGKNLSFSALVVVGDSRGHAGFGMGKAREVPMAIKKGIEQAKKNLQGGGNVAAAKVVGKEIAERAKAAGLAKVVFDRGGYKYHGRVKALADAAREAGLKF